MKYPSVIEKIVCPGEVARVISKAQSHISHKITIEYEAGESDRRDTLIEKVFVDVKDNIDYSASRI